MSNLNSLLKELEKCREFDTATIDKIENNSWRIAPYGDDDYAGYGKTIKKALEEFVKKYIREEVKSK